MTTPPPRRAVRLLAAAVALAAGALCVPPVSAADAETEAGRMLLVLDSSGSMKEPAAGGATKIGAAKQALGRVVDGLPDDAQVGLRVFGAEVFSRDEPGACTDSQLVVRPGTDNREELRDAVAAYQPYGETPIAHALQQAARDLGSEGARSIVLVSDGIATCEPDPCVVARDLRSAGIDLRIDVVGLSVDSATRGQLSCIARAGGGEYYDADSADDIVEQLETATTRALRPFETDGTPIEGGTDLDPTAVEAGRWTDTLGGPDTEEASRWYRFERTIPRSTLHVGASSLGVGSRDGIAVSVYDETERRCAYGIAIKQVVSGELLTAGASAGPGTRGESDECSNGPLLVQVERQTVLGADGETPYSLELVEEPPVAGTDGLPEAIRNIIETSQPEPRSEEPTAVEGGSSFATATEVAPGSYTGEIVPGETQVWKVPVEWGQSLGARVVVPESRGALRETFGYQGPFASLAVLNPLRVDVITTGGRNTGFAAGGRNVLTDATSEVRYLNRAEGNPANLAGYYYVTYATDERPEGLDGAGVPMPFRLEVTVDGEPSGAPDYVEEATASEASPTTAAPTGEATEDDDAQAAAPPADARADDDSGLPVRLLAAGGLGLLAVAAVGGGALLLRRSR